MAELTLEKFNSTIAASTAKADILLGRSSLKQQRILNISNERYTPAILDRVTDADTMYMKGELSSDRLGGDPTMPTSPVGRVDAPETYHGEYSSSPKEQARLAKQQQVLSAQLGRPATQEDVFRAGETAKLNALYEAVKTKGDPEWTPGPIEYDPKDPLILGTKEITLNIPVQRYATGNSTNTSGNRGVSYIKSQDGSGNVNALLASPNVDMNARPTSLLQDVASRTKNYNPDNRLEEDMDMAQSSVLQQAGKTYRLLDTAVNAMGLGEISKTLDTLVGLDKKEKELLDFSTQVADPEKGQTIADAFTGVHPDTRAESNKLSNLAEDQWVQGDYLKSIGTTATNIDRLFADSTGSMAELLVPYVGAALYAANRTQDQAIKYERANGKPKEASGIAEDFAINLALAIPEKILVSMGIKSLLPGMATKTRVGTVAASGLAELPQEYGEGIQDTYSTQKEGERTLSEIATDPKQVYQGVAGMVTAVGASGAANTAGAAIDKLKAGKVKPEVSIKDYLKTEPVENTNANTNANTNTGSNIKDTIRSVHTRMKEKDSDLVGMFNELNAVEADAVAQDDTQGLKYIKKQKQDIADLLSTQVLAEDKLPTLGSQAEDVITDLYVKSSKTMTPTLETNIEKLATKAGISSERLTQIRNEAIVEEEATTGEMGYKSYGRIIRQLQNNPTVNQDMINSVTTKMENFLNSQEISAKQLKSGIDVIINKIAVGAPIGASRYIKYGTSKFEVNNTDIAKWIEQAGTSKKNLYAALDSTPIGRIYKHKLSNITGIKDEALKSNINLTQGYTVKVPVLTKDATRQSILSKAFGKANKLIAYGKHDTSVQAYKNSNTNITNQRDYFEEDVVAIAVPKSTVKSNIINQYNAFSKAMLSTTSKSAPAQIAKAINKVIAKNATIVIEPSTDGYTKKPATRAVAMYLKSKGYVSVNSKNEVTIGSGKWVPSGKVKAKPKVEPTVKEQELKQEVQEDTSYGTKEILSNSSSTGRNSINGQAIDINKIVRHKQTTDNTSKLVTESVYTIGEHTRKLAKDAVKAMKKYIASKQDKKDKYDQEAYTLKSSPARGLLYDKDFNINANAASAIAIAAEEFMAYNSSLLVPKTKEDLERALGLQQGQLSYETFEEVKKLGIPRKLVIDKLGKSILASLDLGQNKEVDSAVYAKLVTDIGTMSYIYMLKHKKYIKESIVPTTKYAEFLGQADRVLNTKATVAFVTLNKAVENTSRETYEAVVNETGLVSTMRKGPKDKPFNSKVTQESYTEDSTIRIEKARKNEVTDVPEENVTILNKLRTFKHIKVQSGIDWIQSNIQLAKEYLGYIDSDTLETMSVEAREAAEATNTEIEKSILELTSIEGKEFYYDWYFTKNGRYMMESNTVNPQTDKLHRFLMIPEAWVSKISKSNQEHMDLFYIAIAQATNYGIDKKQTGKAIARGKEVVALGSKVLKEALLDKKLMKDKLGEESVDHLGHWLQAIEAIESYENNEDSFEISITAEFDAVTSGFGNRNMQMPLVKGWLEKVGVFHGVHEDMSMNDVIDQEGFYDSYQTLAAEISRDAVDPVSNPTHIWKALKQVLPEKGEDGSVSKALRTLFKDPFMTFNYSAGIVAIKKSLGNNITSDLLNRLARDKQESPEVYALYEALNKKGFIDKAKLDMVGKSLTEILRSVPAGKIEVDVLNAKTKVKYKLDEYISQLIQETYGKQVEDSLVKYFTPFMRANTVINTSLKIMFAAYKVQYDKAIKEANTKGDVTLADKLKIIRDLREVFPIIKGPFSTHEYNDGISIVNTRISNATPKYGASQTEVNEKEFKQKSIKVQTLVKEFEAAMNSASVLPFHFIDGAEIGRAIQESNGGQFIHDAIMPKLTDTVKVVKTYNKAVYEVNKEYNLVDAVVEALERVYVKLGQKIPSVEVNLKQNEFASIEDSGMHSVSITDVLNMAYTLANDTNYARDEHYQQDMSIVHMAAVPGSAYTIEGDKSYISKKYDDKLVEFSVFNPKLSKDTHKAKEARDSKSRQETLQDIKGSIGILPNKQAIESLFDEQEGCI